MTTDRALLTHYRETSIVHDFVKVQSPSVEGIRRSAGPPVQQASAGFTMTM